MNRTEAHVRQQRLDALLAIDDVVDGPTPRADLLVEVDARQRDVVEQRVDEQPPVGRGPHGASLKRRREIQPLLLVQVDEFLDRLGPVVGLEHSAPPPGQ